MSARPLRVAVIGANPSYGWSPRAHLPALVALPGVELAAVCTTREESAAESAKKFGAAQSFSDHREMLSKADLDAVAVSVKVPLHHALTMDVLRAGLPVYTEWPLGANLSEAEEMGALAREKGVLTMIGFQGRCHPVFLRLKELVEEGYVGDVLTVSMRQFGGGILSRGSDRIWQADRSKGANTLTISFGHVIDTLCWCLGDFAELSAVVATKVSSWHENDTGRDVAVTSPDNVTVSGTLQSGAVVSAHAASIPWHGSAFRLEVFGREGTLVAESNEHPQTNGMRLFGGKGADAQPGELDIPDRLSWVPETVPRGAPFNVAQMWSRFAEAIRSGERAEPDFDTAVERHRLLESIQKASDTGERQRL